MKESDTLDRTIVTLAKAEWRSIQLSTEPADFDQAEAALAALYAHLGSSVPHFVRLSSPLAAELYINLYRPDDQPTVSRGTSDHTLPGEIPGGSFSAALVSQIIGQFRATLGNGLFNSSLSGDLDPVLLQMESFLGVENKLRFLEAPRQSLRQQLSEQLVAHLGQEGSREARLDLESWPLAARRGYWPPRRSGTWEIYSAWFDAGRRAGAVIPSELEASVELLARISRSVGWWYPYRGFCIIADRPRAIRLDIEQKLHSADKRAIEYRDGTGVYAWHGQAAPAAWFEGSLPTPAEAVSLQSAEHRRIACEMLGWATVLRGLQAKEIDRHANPMIGTLLEVRLPGTNPQRFLRVLCGTGREFALCVPVHVKTAIEAQSLIQRIPPEMVERIEVRT